MRCPFLLHRHTGASRYPQAPEIRALQRLPVTPIGGGAAQLEFSARTRIALHAFRRAVVSRGGGGSVKLVGNLRSAGGRPLTACFGREPSSPASRAGRQETDNGCQQHPLRGTSDLPSGSRKRQRGRRQAVDRAVSLSGAMAPSTVASRGAMQQPTSMNDPGSRRVGLRPPSSCASGRGTPAPGRAGGDSGDSRPA